MKTPPSPVKRLQERVRRYPSNERLSLMRNLSYGAAAACLAVLAGLAQVGAKSAAIQVSVYGAAFALPLWLFIGGAIEYYIFLGKSSYPHLRIRVVWTTLAIFTLLASFGMIAMVGGIIWFLLPGALYAFAASSILALVATSMFQTHIADWWYGPTGPESRETVRAARDDGD